MQREAGVDPLLAEHADRAGIEWRRIGRVEGMAQRPVQPSKFGQFAIFRKMMRNEVGQRGAIIAQIACRRRVRLYIGIGDMAELRVAQIGVQPLEMIGEDEIVATAQGSWTTYELRAVWRPEDGVLQLLAFPDIRVVEDKRSVAHEALAMINEQLWLGHFELWSNSGTILYRHAMLIGSDAAMPLDITETLVESAIDECERFYPVFQFVLWGGKTPAEALAASLIETRGEA